MSPERRQFLTAVGAVGALSACGFTPVETGSSLRGRVIPPEAQSPVEYAFRERLAQRVGAPDAAAARLTVRIEVEETGAAISQGLDTTRLQLSGVAEWRLVADTGEIGAGRVVSLEGFDATANPFAVRAARQAATERLGSDLADKVMRALLGAVQ